MDDPLWDKTRRIVLARDGGKCLRCLGEAHQVHHRKPKGMGGASDPDVRYGLANCISICAACHQDVHSRPEESYQSGFLVHRGMDPELIALQVKPGTFTVLLRNDGTMETISPLVLFL